MAEDEPLYPLMIRPPFRGDHGNRQKYGPASLKESCNHQTGSGIGENRRNSEQIEAAVETAPAEEGNGLNGQSIERHVL
jgi:hypothetical protein